MNTKLNTQSNNLQLFKPTNIYSKSLSQIRFQRIQPNLLTLLTIYNQFAPKHTLHYQKQHKAHFSKKPLQLESLIKKATKTVCGDKPLPFPNQFCAKQENPNGTALDGQPTDCFLFGAESRTGEGCPLTLDRHLACNDASPNLLVVGNLRRAPNYFLQRSRAIVINTLRCALKYFLFFFVFHPLLRAIFAPIAEASICFLLTINVELFGALCGWARLVFGFLVSQLP